MTEQLNLGNKCELCDFISKNLCNHVKKVHGLSTSEYKTRYPEAKLVFVSESQKEQAKKNALEWFLLDENKKKYKQSHCSIWQKKYWVEKGLSETEAEKKVGDLQKRTFSAKTRELYSVQRSGELNSMSLPNISKRFGVTLEEARALTPCFGRTKELHPMFGKHHTSESLMKICANTPITFFNKSKGEKELQDFVATLGKIETNKAKGIFNCDIVLEECKLIIEFFGDYWHCNPAKFNGEDYNKRLHLTAKERWLKDQKKQVYYQELQYEYFVVWEYDWKHNKEKIKEQIKCIINKTKSPKLLN